MKKLNLIRSSIALLCMVLFAFIFSCKDNDNQIAPTVNTAGQEEIEVNTIDLGDDPTFVNEDERNGRTLSVDVVKASRIRVYLNKMSGAEGKVSIHVYRTSDNVRVSRSGRKNVSELATHSTTSIKYTSLYHDVNLDLARNQEYRIEVLCEGCVPNNNEKAVHWWSSSNDEYADGSLITPFGDVLSGSDMTFSVECKTPDGLSYSGGMNTRKVIAYPINLGNMKAGQTFKAHIPFDYNTACLLQGEASTAEAVVFAGSPTEAGNVNGKGTAARLAQPSHLTIDNDDNLYISEFPNLSVRKIDPSGNVTTVATDASNPDVDNQGNLYYVTPSSGYKKLYKRTPIGTVTLIAALSYPVWDLTVDNAGNVFVLPDVNERLHIVEKISSTGLISTVAGSMGNAGSADGQGEQARFDFSLAVWWDIAYDEVNNALYVTDSNGLRKIAMDGTVTTIPVDWNSGLNNFIMGLAIDNRGNVYLQANNAKSCKLQPNGDCCPVIKTDLYIAVSSKGTVFYCDRFDSSAIYKVVTK